MNVNVLDVNSVLAWMGTMGFMITQYFESIIGMILTGATAVFYILKLRQNWINLRNEEKRKDERHRLEMKQEKMELQNLKNKKTDG